MTHSSSGGSKPKKPTPPVKTETSPSTTPKKVITVGGSGNSGGHGGGSHGSAGNNNERPSPWLDSQNPPKPHKEATFVEYLRWMRPAEENQYKDGTKTELLHLATNNTNYNTRLTQLTNRTELIAGKANTFEVKCPWRIRVGGHRGPESILLPAFDALGIPYIPSSSLRGVARNQAIRETMTEKNCGWKEAEKDIAVYFGSLEAEKQHQAGKVVFLDAYPIPNQCGLTMDMANNIWQWENNGLKYNPNPNLFLSLKEPTFLIGLKLTAGGGDPEILQKVKQWLIKGLQSGIGSQVNSGYGELLTAGASPSPKEFYRMKFELEGQLIHGHKQFNQWNERHGRWEMKGSSVAETRPIAFKSMLRYWFRCFALGVLPVGKVQELESKIFGGINPEKQWGWLKVDVYEGKVTQREPRGKNDPCGEETGILTLSLSDAAPEDKSKTIKALCKNLAWLMFNLGGIGQGARRPCYQRTGQYAPWYRGSTFSVSFEQGNPETAKAFKTQFHDHLPKFYNALSKLAATPIDVLHPRPTGTVTQTDWKEAIDANCQIIVCSGPKGHNKPHALSVLHSAEFKLGPNKDKYDGDLCGQVQGGVKASPVWIVDSVNYQVVTVFGATVNPRSRYLEVLKNQSQQFIKLWPLS